jgi:hypothetical protein
MGAQGAAGVELPPPARKTIDLEGRIVKDGVGKTVKDRQLALNELVKAIREFRKFTDQPLSLRGLEYANAVQELNKAIDLGRFVQKRTEPFDRYCHHPPR